MKLERLFYLVTILSKILHTIHDGLFVNLTQAGITSRVGVVSMGSFLDWPVGMFERDFIDRIEIGRPTLSVAGIILWDGP